ncbi:coiled-coil domain-containing protein 148 [Electrophorus electricus]|uniref:coiled-coil domain-containing protein 148 n=1 Tax=Electrophorus electricus TaxID=8005 RepID=UPI0015D02A3C|nr:coiled-coil domain-containing protein 148 [Electrophorus electricus]
MSGRDLRAFLATRRAEDAEKLTQRAKNGLGLPKYKPVVYEELHAMVQAKRLSSEHAQCKMQKAMRADQIRRENFLLRQHRQLWSVESHKLARARERAAADVRGFLACGRLEEEDDGHLLSELLEYELSLEHDREVFRLATVVPVCQLREDLLYRLTSGPLAANQHTECMHVLQQVAFVKKQQQAVMDRLQDECCTLQQELSAAGQEARLASAELAECVAALVQLPDEVMAADYPSAELGACVISAFHSLADKYTERLEVVQSRLLDMDRNCGWCEEDHLRFLHTVRQYSPELRHHRGLCRDLLQRVLPHLSRAELSNHERSWDWYRFSVAQERLVLESWSRERAALRLQALGALEEARAKHQEQQALHRDRCHQQHACALLKHKLQQWREKQEEVAQLEVLLAAQWHEEEKEREREEQEREQAKRTSDKERVREFYAELGRRRAECRQREEARLVELRGVMEEQARRDKERVEYREQLLEHRKQEQEAKEKLKERDEDERKERLKRLRSQVAVVADADPERMMGQTEAWRTRLQPDKEEFILQRPLYDLYTYTDKQIVADPRVRIEQALRMAGVHHTAYARELLSAVRPPKPPRRDTESSALSS